MPELLIPDHNKPHEERVMSLVSFYPTPLPMTTIAFMLGLDPSFCKKILDRLIADGRLRVATKHTVSFYGTRDSSNAYAEKIQKLKEAMS